MTTKHAFLTKIFNENEKAKNVYKDYDFSQYSPDKIYLLEKLSIISKYKSFFKSILLRKKISDTEKFNYIVQYKQSLTYSEYIKFNVMLEDNENSFINCLYLLFGINFFCFVYFLTKRPVNQPIIKEMSYSILFSLITTYSYYSYTKISYRNALNGLYESLEKTLNDFPELKNENYNKNFVSEDNYDEILDESI